MKRTPHTTDARTSRTIRWIAFSLILLSVPFSTRAQISIAGGNLNGSVVDTAGDPVPGASVEIRNAATGQVRSVTTDARGDFRASELAVGVYNVEVRKAGFAPYLHTGVGLTVGQSVRLQIRLAPARLVQKVTVSSEPSALNPEATSMTTTVGRERIEELPVQTRNALDFVLLAAGVSASNPSNTPASKAAPLLGSGFSFSGLRPTSNSLSIDGVENNDEFSGGSRTELSPEIVQEFQVVNNGLSAEYGGASGGSIDVITRTGANATHGDAFIFYQNGALNARQPLESESNRSSLTRYRAGFSRGGAIQRNRTFYYAAFEQEHLRAGESSDISPDVASSVSSLLASGAFPGLATRHLTEGFFPVAFSETEASAKLDRQLSSRESLALRYAFTNNKNASDAFNTGGLEDASSAGSAFTRDHSLTGSLATVLSPAAVNTLRFQFARRNVALRTNDQSGPGITINGLADFGRPYAGNSRRREDHYDASDVLALARGTHFLKLGGDAMHVHLNASQPDGFGGLYIFPNLSTFLNGQPDTFRQAFGNPGAAFGTTSYGAFFQDHWSLAHRVTLDLGLRYDFDRLPRGFNQDSNNVSPRVGLAYSPSSRWVFRAGYGIFFDRYLLDNLNRAIEKNGVQAFEQVVNGPAAAQIFRGTGGGPLAAPLDGVAPSIFSADPKLATPYSQQASLGAEYLISRNFTLKADGLYVRGLKLARTLNTNLPPPVALTSQNAAALGVLSPSPQQIGREVFGPSRIDPALNDVYQLQDSASSTYKGFSLSVERRLEDFTLGASYTISKVIDNASSFAEQPQNPYDLRGERARSLDDQRQRFVLSGLFDLPFGNNEEGAPTPNAPGAKSPFWGSVLSNIEVAPILTLGSGQPANPLTGLDSNGNDAIPLSSRPLGIGRNALHLPGFDNLDLRLLKAIYFRRPAGSHLDLVVESFNSLNHTNVIGINPFYGPDLSPMDGFATPIEAATARRVEFSVDFEY